VPVFQIKPEDVRWRISHNWLWALGQEADWTTKPARRILMHELRLYDDSKTRSRVKSRGDEDDNEYVRNGWCLFPVSNLAAAIHVERMEGGTVPLRPDEVCYDLLPTSAESALLFVLNEKLMRVYRGKRREATPPAVGAVVQYEDAGRFPVDFQEPFWVFGEAPFPFFVTRSGKVYGFRLEGDRSRPKLQWGEKDRPVVAAVQDVDQGVTYLLAESQRAFSKSLRLDQDGKMTERLIDPEKLRTPPGARTNGKALDFARYLMATGTLSSK
jgi:hypothetical protein